MISTKLYIKAICLVGLEDMLADQDCNLPDLLAELEIPQSALTNIDQLIHFRKFVHLLELIAVRTNQPNFGLLCVEKAAPGYAHVGPLLLLTHFVKDLKEWIETGIKFWRLHTNGYNVELIIPPETGEAIVRIVGPADFRAAPQFSEHVLGLLVAIARLAGSQPNENPNRVYFQHRKPRDCSLHEKIFRCPIVFDAAHNEVVFDAKFLAFQSVGGLRLLKPLISIFVRERIRRLPNFDMSMAATVAQVIPSLIGTGKCKLEVVAEALNLPSKQLQRQLTAEGITFSAILEETRLKLAENLLCDSNVAISKIAGLLDYSSTPPFTLAFRRWTGQSPLEFRKRYLRANAKPLP